VQHQLQSIGRGFEGQGLSRALIEPQSNAISEHSGMTSDVSICPLAKSGMPAAKDVAI
jgi:hypothetical protein